MRFFELFSLLGGLALLLGLIAPVRAAEYVELPIADGFELPVGRNGQSYYKSRSVRENGHLGEDWNGIGGGNSDLGDPIYCVADGVVVMAQMMGGGWGGVVITRHAYLEGREVKYVDALYGILFDFSVTLGQPVKRGQQVGRMGNDRGRYSAHLHFEMRKNIQVGLWRTSFPRDFSIYWSPSDFIAAHPVDEKFRRRIAKVPVNTYPKTRPPLVAGPNYHTPALPLSRAGVAIRNGMVVETNRPLSRTSPSTFVARNGEAYLRRSLPKAQPEKVAPAPTPRPRRPDFRVDRFEDMRILGYE